MDTIQSIPGFRDFDDAEVCATVEEAVVKETTLNFAVEFDNDKAFAAVDLDSEGLRRYLAVKRAPQRSTRWINIFAPDQQAQSVKHIAQYYNFSPRLTGIMCSKQHTPSTVGTRNSISNSRSDGQPMRTGKICKSMDSLSADLEMHSVNTAGTSEAPALDLSHYRLVNEVWHYSSVDWDAHRKSLRFELCNIS